MEYYKFPEHSPWLHYLQEEECNVDLLGRMQKEF